MGLVKYPECPEFLHLIGFVFTGEVTPGLSQVEYALRRHKLMVLIQKEAQDWNGLDHTVILLSNPTYYMSNDIPYVFHQDTNFLYLCGFQEPDSILVLQSIPGKALPAHKSILFVPRRDPNRELWDGPRSGPDGAIALTGVDEAYTIEEFRHLVAKLKGNKNRGGMRWDVVCRVWMVQVWEVVCDITSRLKWTWGGAGSVAVAKAAGSLYYLVEGHQWICSFENFWLSCVSMWMPVCISVKY